MTPKNPARGVLYQGPEPPRSRSETTAPWLVLLMVDKGYTDNRDGLGLPRLGETLHTESVTLWEAYLALGSWSAVADEWRERGMAK